MDLDDESEPLIGVRHQNKPELNLPAYDVYSTSERKGEIQPVLLSPEILEACGFKPGTSGWFSIGIFLIKQDDHGWKVDDNDTWNNITTVQYLHELQNLHFAIQREELPIHEFNAKSNTK
jgi:hypothetical protein